MDEKFFDDFTNDQLMTIGNFIFWDLKSNPQQGEERKKILADILLELERRNVIDRLDAAAAHKSLQKEDYAGISIFHPDGRSVADEKVNNFLKQNMQNFGIVIHWTKKRFHRN